MPKSRFARDAGSIDLSAAAQPLYAALRDRLKREILAGKRKPGDKLPSESEFTAEFGVSRITVRQALGDLQKEGLLVKAHGKGSFVSLPPVAQDLTRLRGLSESLSGAGRAIHTRVLSLRLVRPPADVASALRAPRGAKVIELRTLRYLNRKPLVLSRSWMPREIGKKLARADLANRDILSIYENDLGVAIGHADVSIGAITAEASRHRALGVAAGAALVFMRRLVHTRVGRPLHLEASAYRADLFSVSLTLDRGDQ